MNDVVAAAFHGAIAALKAQLDVMPLSRWNESVFRYFYCRYLATNYPDVDQYVECDKIDLVLFRDPDRAFVEFKFYTHPPRFDSLTGKVRGYKGGPSSKNLGEFKSCIDHLHNRANAANLTKWVVLVYGDPSDGSRPRSRYSRQYDDYRHPSTDVSVARVDSCDPIRTHDAEIRAHLYRLVS